MIYLQNPSGLGEIPLCKMVGCWKVRFNNVMITRNLRHQSLRFPWVANHSCGSCNIQPLKGRQRGLTRALYLLSNCLLPQSHRFLWNKFLKEAGLKLRNICLTYSFLCISRCIYFWSYQLIMIFGYTSTYSIMCIFIYMLIYVCVHKFMYVHL